MRLGADQSECLKGSLAIWSEWGQGRGDPAKLTNFFACAGNSLEMFLQRTRGNASDRYSPEELRSFLTKYFITSFKISDAMLDEAMVLKEVMVGGRKDSVTDEEIHRILVWFSLLKKHSIAMIPHMPMTPARLAVLSRAKIEAAMAALGAAASEIGTEIEKQRKDYSFAALTRAYTELKKIGNTQAAEPVMSRMRLMTLLKSLLIGPDRKQITGTEWKRMLIEGARDYSTFVKFSYLDHNHKDWTYGAGRKTLVELSDDLLRILETALTRQPRGYIQFAQIDELLSLLENDEIPMAGLARNRAALKEFVRPLFRRLLGGSDRSAEGRAAPGLTRGLLARLKVTLHRWSATQNALETSFATLARDGTGQANDGLTRMGFPGAKILSTRPGAEVEKLLKLSPSMYRGRDKEITFDSSAEGDKFWFRGLSRANWMSEVARLMVSGYAQAPIRAQNASAITQSEFHCFTDDLRKFGIAAKFVDSRKYDMHYKRFVEANLFMYSADGNNLLSHAETTQLLAYLTSADAHARRVYKKAYQVCTRSSSDPMGVPLLEARCLREQYFGNFADTYTHMPDLVRWYYSLSNATKSEFHQMVENASRNGGYSDRPMELGDLQAFATVMQYVETLFARFDADQSGGLNADEAMNAFPLFHRTLTQLVTTVVTDPSMRERVLEVNNLKALFAWLLTYGEKPNTDTIVGKARFWAWSHQFPSWNFEADRSRILGIFVELAKAGGPMPVEQTRFSSCWSD